MADPIVFPADVVARFWAKVEKTNDCWLWTAGLNQDGRGKFAPSHRQTIAADRFSWLIHFGEIPHHLFLLRRCPNSRCVRPEHLWLGTKAEQKAFALANGLQTTRFKHGLWREGDYGLR